MPPGSGKAVCRAEPVASGAVRAAPGALSARTRTSTPSDSPTHSGAVAPRTRPEVLSGVPGSAAWSALWVSSSCQSDQEPVAVARVRT